MTAAGLLFRWEAIAGRWRAAKLRMSGVNIGPHARIAAAARIRLTWLDGYGQISLGAAADVREGAIIESWGGDIRVGRNVFFGPHVVVYGHGGIEIGDETLISMHACILSSNHRIPEFGRSIRAEADELRPTQIGRDVWIGAQAVILGGVAVGDGCVIGAGAVVTRSLPPGAVAHGVPASIQRFRPDSPRTPASL